MKTGHIGVNVTNLERSLSFYEAVFGFDIIARSGQEGRKYAYLGKGGNITVTLWEQSSGAFDSAKPGLHHLAFEAGSMEEVKELEQRVRGLGAALIYGGVVPHSEGAHSGGIFFLDPDGIRLEIYTPHGAEEGAGEHADGPACGFF